MTPAAHRPAILALADGSIFRGTAIGADGISVGELVFNTAMSGYQEIISDPSYARQIVTLTYPHIGNVGANAEDDEGERVWAAGLVIRDLPLVASNFRKEEDLDSYLKRNNVIGIAELDTRRLTRLIRDKGAQNACLMAGEIDEEKAVAAAREFSGLEGLDLAKEVSTREIYNWNEGSWALGQGFQKPAEEGRYKVVVYDFGVKRNILRQLVDHGCDLAVVPAETPAADVLAMKPDGVFLSNGPGDPQACTYAIEAVKEIVEAGLPVFGICFGHQILALASGARTRKMKLGHHGANHPVQELSSKAVLITSQNHGFVVDDDSLGENLIATHRSLFDQTLQGIRRTDRPAFGFQGHPEASPGPRDVESLFDQFVDLMQAHSGG